jgi:hypothetical protein
MESILLEPKNDADFTAIKELALKLGIEMFPISEKNKRFLAGLKMIEIAEKHPKFDLTDEEIMNMVKENEEKYYNK